jgi:predicted DNA-binding transcriptional regulator AlpA
MGNAILDPPAPAPTDDELVDWRPAADLLTLKERAFWKAVHELGVPHYRLRPKVIRFRLSEIRAWLAARRFGSTN